MSTNLTIEEARSILHQGASAGHLALMEASNCIMELCEDEEAVTIDDMLRCLDFPNTTISEMGARALYVRTGRDGLGWNSPNFIDDVTDDKDNWIAYLKDHGWA